MHEVVIERPRGGPRVRRRPCWNWRAHDDEAFPKQESTSRNRGGTKWLSDLLGPLRRFLRSAVGRPWDEVYSEIRAVIRADTELHRHVLLHLDDMVEGRWFFVSQEGRLEYRERPRIPVRDARRGDVVSPRRFFLRRIGRPWAQVEEEFIAGADASNSWAWREQPWRRDSFGPWVTLSVVRPLWSGRVHAMSLPRDDLPMRVHGPLGRGRLYVENGVLKVVR